MNRWRFLWNIRSAMIPICFRSQGLRKRAMYWAFRLMSVLNFPFRNLSKALSKQKGDERAICCLSHKIIKHQHIVRLWVNFPRIFFKLWKATNKLNFLSDIWLHHFVGILQLAVVPPYSPRFLALVKNTIRCKNFFNEKCFTTLSGAHHEKWKLMSKPGGERCLQRNLLYSPPASMTSRLSSVAFKMASKVFIVEKDKNWSWLDGIPQKEVIEED